MRSLRILRPALALGALALLAACQRIDPGPSLPSDGSARSSVYGHEPKPAPIPQKNIPEGKSSLAPN